MTKPLLSARVLLVRSGLVLAGAVAALCASARAQVDDSLARVLPADVGLFMELRQGADLLVPLVEPQLWLTLAQLAGQPAALSESEQWARRVEQTIKMPPAEAIRTLFSQRVAFVAEDVRATHDAVVVCRPQSPPGELLRRWPARPLPSAGRAAVYRLPHRVGLAVYNDLLIFGEHGSRGTFERVLEHVEGHRANVLSDDPLYQRLLTRVPADPDGVLLVRFRPAAPASRPVSTPAPSATRPATRTPLSDAPFGGSSNVLLALHRRQGLLHISAVGDAARSTSTAAVPVELVGNLPARTLVAWAGPIDYRALTHSARTLPEGNMLRVILGVQERPGTIERLLETLKPAGCIAAGVATPTARHMAPPLPSLALLLPARDPAGAAQAWSELFHSSVALYKLLSLKLATPPRLALIAPVTIAGLSAEQLDLSPLFSGSPHESLIGQLHLSWALDDDVLIIASHSDWLRQILEARHGQGPRLAPVLELSQRPADAPQQTVFVAQSGPLADLGSAWLRHLQQALPEVLSESWWRTRQPGGSAIRLGAQVLIDRERQRLIVQSVTPGTPADGALRPGDEVVGCNHRRFATSQPIEELQRGLAERPNARWIDLLVERDRFARVKRIALPFVDPVEVLRRIVAIGQVVQRVVYFDAVPDADGPRGYLTLELRAGQGPLFDFTMQPATGPAITGPTTAPAGVPTP